MPYFWLDYSPEAPAIFSDRREGYLAKMAFNGDIHRLEVDGSDALVTMSFSHDGRLFKTEPPMRVPLSDLRFKREAVERVAEIINKTAQPQAAAPAPVVGENAEQRQARRWQMCLDAGLSMPQDTYAQLPRGINEIAKAEGITRQALAQDLNAYRERLFGK